MPSVQDLRARTASSIKNTESLLRSIVSTSNPAASSASASILSQSMNVSSAGLDGTTVMDPSMVGQSLLGGSTIIAGRADPTSASVLEQTALVEAQLMPAVKSELDTHSATMQRMSESLKREVREHMQQLMQPIVSEVETLRSSLSAERDSRIAMERKLSGIVRWKDSLDETVTSLRADVEEYEERLQGALKKMSQRAVDDKAERSRMFQEIDTIKEDLAAAKSAGPPEEFSSALRAMEQRSAAMQTLEIGVKSLNTHVSSLQDEVRTNRALLQGGGVSGDSVRSAIRGVEDMKRATESRLVDVERRLVSFEDAADKENKMLWSRVTDCRQVLVGLSRKVLQSPGAGRQNVNNSKSQATMNASMTMVADNGELAGETLQSQIQAVNERVDAVEAQLEKRIREVLHVVKTVGSKANQLEEQFQAGFDPGEDLETVRRLSEMDERISNALRLADKGSKGAKALEDVQSKVVPLAEQIEAVSKRVAQMSRDISDMQQRIPESASL